MGFQLIMGFFGMTMGFFGMNLGFFGKNMGFISDPTFITSKCTAIFEKVVLDLSILRRPIPRAVVSENVLAKQPSLHQMAKIQI